MLVFYDNFLSVGISVGGAAHARLCDFKICEINLQGDDYIFYLMIS